MPHTERIRQNVSGEMNVKEFKDFQRQGWRLVAVEWERELAGEESSAPIDPVFENPPFGTRVKDASTLETDPKETEVLLTMMELLIQDGPYSFIAEELNRRGYRTRQGSVWTPVSVFQMLPRLIEAGPSIFSTNEWQRRRNQALQRPRLPV